MIYTFTFIHHFYNRQFSGFTGEVLREKSTLIKSEPFKFWVESGISVLYMVQILLILYLPNQTLPYKPNLTTTRKNVSNE